MEHHYTFQEYLFNKDATKAMTEKYQRSSRTLLNLAYSEIMREAGALTAFRFVLSASKKSLALCTNDSLFCVKTKFESYS